MCFRMLIVNSRQWLGWGGIAAALLMLLTSRVGGQAAVDSSERCLERASAFLSEMGASEVGPVEEIFLVEGETWERSAEVLAGECISWLGIAGGALEDLDLYVLDHEGQALVQDIEADLPPRLRFCAEQDGSVLLRAVAFRGSGPIRIATFRGGDESALEALVTVGSCFAGAASPPARVSDLGPLPRGRASIGTEVEGQVQAEPLSPLRALLAVWERRGLEPSALEDMRLGGGRVVDTRMQLPEGRCAAIGATSRGEYDAEQWVDIAVVDHQGERIGWDLRRRGWASVYTCGRAGETMRVRIRVRGSEADVTLYSGSPP